MSDIRLDQRIMLHHRLRFTTAPAVARQRKLALFVIASAVLSFVVFAFAAWAYPGGNHFDHAAKAHDFWKNSLCDVARPTAIGGASNAIGSTLAQIAMSTMALGIGGLFWLVPNHFDGKRRRFAPLVRALGSICVPAAVAVVFLPTDRFGILHGIAIVIAGAPGLTAALLSVAGLVQSRPAHSSSSTTIIASLGVITLSVAAVDFALYVTELIANGHPQVAVPVLERVAALLILAWMVLVAKTSLRVAR